MLQERDERARLLKLATGASVLTALVLIVAKLLVWLATGSVSVLASLVDSLMDALASLVNLFAVRFSLQPADDQHRFGHGKAEALAGLGQAAFIMGSALFLVLQSVERLLRPQPIEAIGLGVAVIVFSLLATALLVTLQRYVVRRTGSTAIKADSLHYFSDFLSNGAVLLALGLAAWGWGAADAWLALGIAVYIAWTAARIGGEAVQLLLDRELPEALRARIVALAFAAPEVRGVHDLKTRRSGHQSFIQLHLELDDAMSLLQAHAVAERVTRRIEDELPGAEVIVHQDPASTVEAGRVTPERRPVRTDPGRA